MSAISNDALQKVILNLLFGSNAPIPISNISQVLQEIGQKKAFSEQQLSIVRQQKVAKNREGRLLQLTSEEVKTLPEGTRVYEGVGKM
jgi:prefoldin subunit 1